MTEEQLGKLRSHVANAKLALDDALRFAACDAPIHNILGRMHAAEAHSRMGRLLIAGPLNKLNAEEA